MANGTDQQFQHIVTTPFYVRRRLGFSQKFSIASNEWLEERIRLFEQYCLPSVANQSTQDFTWILYFDEETPQALLGKVERLIGNYPNFKIYKCKQWGNDVLISSITDELRSDTQWILSTRLDNDDGWHKDFVAGLHKSIKVGSQEFLNYSNGILYYREKTYLYTHLSNAFISFSEPRENFQTVWSRGHEELASVAPIRQIGPQPAFLQVVHGGNVSNKPRGVRIPRRSALVGFETIDVLFHNSDRENWFSIFWENNTSVLAWKLRDTAVRVVKSAARLARGGGEKA